MTDVFADQGPSAEDADMKQPEQPSVADIEDRSAKERVEPAELSLENEAFPLRRALAADTHTNNKLSPEFENKVAMIVSGAYGTAIAARMVEHGYDVLCYHRDPEVVRCINEEGYNPRVGKDVKLPADLKATSDMSELLEDRGVLFFGAPAKALDQVAKQISPHPESIVVNLAKGFVFPEEDPFSEPSVYKEGPKDPQQRVLLPVHRLQELDGWQDVKAFVAVGGAGFAKNILRGSRVTLMVGTDNEEAREKVEELLSGPKTVIYTTPDSVGIQLAGAMKNVMALAAGMIDSLKETQGGDAFFPEERSHVFSQAIKEMRSFRIQCPKTGQWKLKAFHRTLLGTAGTSDFEMCFNSAQSRNYRAGYMLGRGEKLEDIIADLRTVEGLSNAWAAKMLADQSEPPGVNDGVKRKLYLPITNAVVDVIQGKSPKKILKAAFTHAKSLADEIIVVDKTDKGDEMVARWIPDRSGKKVKKKKVASARAESNGSVNHNDSEPESNGQAEIHSRKLNGSAVESSQNGN